MERLFVDTDIVLDLLGAREPHFSPVAILFSMADQGSIRLYVSAITFANVNYVLSRQLNESRARRLLLKLKTLVRIAPVNEKIIELSLSSDFRDFEDAIQYHSAIENNIQTLLTRNLRDFKKAQISIMTAQQYLDSIK